MHIAVIYCNTLLNHGAVWTRQTADSPGDEK